MYWNLMYLTNSVKIKISEALEEFKAKKYYMGEEKHLLVHVLEEYIKFLNILKLTFAAKANPLNLRVIINFKSQ